MKTAVIYARYSSDRQTEQSIEGQVRVCREYAQRNDIAIVGTYIDRATTGTNDNREQFQKMLKDSDKRAWDYVLCYKLDRFSRNKYEMAVHRKHLKDNGVKILSAMENIPETPEGVLLESLLEGMNQYYSEELSQKTRRGLRETRIKGNFIGGPINYGYSVIKTTENGIPVSKVIINEQEAPILLQIFTEYANGKRLKDILQGLNEKGITNRGKPFKENAVYAMLQQEKYTGIYRIRGETYSNIFPQIIPENIFQTTMNRIIANKYGKHVAGIDYILKGKIFCGHCGTAMSSATGTSMNGNVFRYYKCYQIKKLTGCHTKAIKKELLEQIVLHALTCELTKDKNMKLLASGITERFRKNVTDNPKLNIYEKELASVDKALTNILGAIENGIYTRSTKSRLQELEEKKHNLEEAILIEKANIKEVPTGEEIIKYISSSLKLIPKALIDVLVERIFIFENKIQIKLKYPGLPPHDTPTNKNERTPDRKENSCRGFPVINYLHVYQSYHTRTYKSNKTHEFRSDRHVWIEFYI